MSWSRSFLLTHEISGNEAIMDVTGHGKDGYDTHHCEEDPAAMEEEYYILKHQDLCIISTNRDSMLLHNALHNNVVRK